MEVRESTYDGSYVRNCLIKFREDHTDFLFGISSDGSKMLVKLDGYAIVPIYEYEELVKK